MAVAWYDLKLGAYHMTSTSHVTFNASHAMGYGTACQANKELQTYENLHTTGIDIKLLVQSCSDQLMVKGGIMRR